MFTYMYYNFTCAYYTFAERNKLRMLFREFSDFHIRSTAGLQQVESFVISVMCDDIWRVHDNFLIMLSDYILMSFHTVRHYTHCVPRAPVCEVWSRPYLFAYCLNTYKTMHCAQFRPLNLNAALRQGRNRTKCIVW